VTARREGLYDTLTAREQELVRVAWDEQLDERARALNLESEFTASGDSWVEADTEGRTVVRGATREPASE
jgi:hypothetical protein